MQLLIIKQDTPSHSKGDIVEIRATGTPFGGLEPDSFVLVEVPDIPMVDYEHCNGAWNTILDYEVVNQNLALDGFRLKVCSTTQSVSELGGITKDQVETYLNSWGANVLSFALNEVVFDFGIYAGVISQAFWEILISSVVCTEISYNQDTGTHRIQADYSALGNNPTYVERYVRGKQATIVSHAEKIIVFDISRSVVLAAFKQDIKEKAEKMIKRRRYYVTHAVVDFIVSLGGVLTITETELLAYIKDKVAD